MQDFAQAFSYTVLNKLYVCANNYITKLVHHSEKKSECWSSLTRYMEKVGSKGSVCLRSVDVRKQQPVALGSQWQLLFLVCSFSPSSLHSLWKMY